MSVHPTLGVTGAKPRLLPKAEGNGETSKEALAALSAEYLRSRNSQMASKAALSAMELARRQGELLDRRWVCDSVAYVVTCFRQRCLGSPPIAARQLVAKGLVDEANEHAVSEALKADMHTLLTELANLHLKATNPNWLRELERKETGSEDDERRQTPREHKATQARAARRAEKKIASQQVRRGHG